MPRPCSSGSCRTAKVGRSARPTRRGWTCGSSRPPTGIWRRRSSAARSGTTSTTACDVVLEVPPLRERREDIPLLVEHVRRQVNARHGLGGRRRRPKGAGVCSKSHVAGQRPRAGGRARAGDDLPRRRRMAHARRTSSCRAGRSVAPVTVEGGGSLDRLSEATSGSAPRFGDRSALRIAAARGVGDERGARRRVRHLRRAGTARARGAWRRLGQLRRVGGGPQHQVCCSRDADAGSSTSRPARSRRRRSRTRTATTWPSASATGSTTWPSRSSGRLRMSSKCGA